MLENYQELANAIIELAVKDYRKLSKGYQRIVQERDLTKKKAARKELEYKMRGIRRKLTDLEAFFTSKWFSELTTISGEMVVDRLRKECRL